MDKKLYVYWFIAETSTAVFLLRGLSTWLEISGFLASHGMAVGITYVLFGTLIGTDKLLRRKVITRAFTAFLFTVSAVPLIGPAATLFFCIFLRFFPIYPVPVESYDKVNRDVLVGSNLEKIDYFHTFYFGFGLLIVIMALIGFLSGRD